MRRVGLVTLDTLDNYGNKLQNYALQSFLETCGNTVDTLWHSSINAFSLDLKKWPLQRRLRYSVRGNKVKRRVEQCILESIRAYRFYQFTCQYIHPTYEYIDLEKSNAEGVYDFLITGSDQVWNPNLFTKAEDVFLLFAPQEKRIAYAASFGISEIPEKWKDRFAQWLTDMKAISVREQRGVEIVKELTGRTVPVLVDPTILITAQEWNEMARSPYWLKQNGNKGYILLYFLGKMPSKVKENAYQLAKSKNLTVIDLMDRSNMEWYLSSPTEFLYLIAHAELVYTDSFHGTVFSILYHRPFIVCEKTEKRKGDSMNSRLLTLLERFRYTERLVTEDIDYMVSNPFDMDFTNVDLILAKEREKSVRFMQNALSVDKE